MGASEASERRAQGLDLAVLAPPLVVEGLRLLGCRIVAATGFTAQFPALVARTRAGGVVVFSDGRDPDGLLAALTAARALVPSARIVVLLPTSPMTDVTTRLRELDIESALHGVAAPDLRILLGLEPVTAGHLTGREVDVLTLAAEGLTNQAIARRLGLQPDTVKNYLRSVHRKIGARSRTEAVMLAARAGYCVLPEQVAAASLRPTG